MAPPTSRFVLLDRRTLSISIALILAVAFAAPALADYLGPDRVTTEFQLVHVPEKDVWTLTHVDPDDGFSDVCLIIHPCSEHPSVERQQDLCGWTADNSGCTEWWEEQEVTVTYPEATIAAELQNCDLVNGWCTSSPTLNLTGSEPVAGETITLIEGTRNGEAFACEGASCGVPLLEGQNDFTFWAHSSWGDTSQMGTLSAKVDSQGPSIGISDEWFIWEPLAIQVDDPRGVELIELTVKGGEYGNRYYQWSMANLPGDWIWDRYFGEIVAPIGDYSVTVEAWDALGNGSTAHGTIVIPPPEEPEDEPSAALLEAESDAETEDSETAAETSGSTDESGAETTESEPAAEPSSGASEDPSDEAPSSSADPETNDPSAAASALTTSDQEAQATVPPSGGGSGVLWGAAAAAAIGAASAYGLNRRRRREAAIAAKRKELAERRSARNFANHLKSLRQAAEARIVPVRDAMSRAGSQSLAAASALLAGAIIGANRIARVSQERLAELYSRLGDSDLGQGSTLDPSSDTRPTASSNPHHTIDPRLGHEIHGGDHGQTEPADTEQPNFLERFWKELIGPESVLDTATDEGVTDAAKTIRFLPNIHIPLPIIRGLGFDDLFGRPLTYALDNNAIIRAAGHVLGDISFGPLLILGEALTIGPSLYANVKAGESWNVTASDVLIDTGGFIVGEAVGWVAGIGVAAITLNVPAGVVVKLSADAAASAGWHIAMDSIGANEWLSQRLADAAERLDTAVQDAGQRASDSLQLGREDELRFPTPEPSPVPEGTPQPDPNGTGVPTDETGPNPTSTPAPPQG